MAENDFSAIEVNASKSFAELRSLAMRLAAQLPDTQDEAECVVGLLCDLLQWLHPNSRPVKKETNGGRDDE